MTSHVEVDLIMERRRIRDKTRQLLDIIHGEGHTTKVGMEASLDDALSVAGGFHMAYDLEGHIVWETSSIRQPPSPKKVQKKAKAAKKRAKKGETK